jgi:SAM-dependent methyltransferase
VSGAGGFDYEGVRWGEESLRPGERSIAGFRLAEALRCLPERGRLLEVGCGAGRFLAALAVARPGLALTGSDVSRGALAAVGRRLPGVETRLAAGDSLPARDAEFDAVLVLDVLEHLSDPARMLAEVRRVLVPGGVLHAHVPCEGDGLCLWRWLPGAHAWKRRFGGHVQRFRRRELLASIEAAGFEILRVRGSLHLLGNLADVATFAGIALAARLCGRATSTGAILAASRQPGERASARLGAACVRAVDALLWAEAKLLSRAPSWSVHVSARTSV